ncbi:MAG: hypothetical protein HC881_13235 [Leptolyngbyaceae cyanobacterium SL_7_1]|nr:hypothetical protein [Leptolyngbyaceae cyanobacterium SL_7_1]
MTIVEAIATDNLVSRNEARYPAAELPTLARYLVNKPASINHPNAFRGSVEDEWGTIITAEVQTTPPPLDLSAENAAIVAAEGYFQIRVKISCADDVAHLDAFRKALRLRVSISAIYSYMRCPGCKCGENIFSRECVNDFWTLPYYERHGVTDALEISLVSVPAVRSACVVSIDGEPV